ncbi:hypothetical protein P6U16_01260 [Rhizobium sp. 32-5/1]|uniref:hypothetical protein n=1 Tax=Rhizobium sp. 32-5/1 TaxID=3019602 RepID=UPI00240D7BF3|nr:hypothetical protein [Rhizobium sp. 32-5/1]WEZ83514.1 hypothetical protein P6U16_01260 [Rhizobium sp. 32-5/1]
MIWEVFQGLGAMVGLVTGGFVFYEHLMRHAPLAYVVTTPFMEHGSRYAYVRIDNRSPRPILISWPSGIQDNRFTIGKDHSSRSIVEALLDGERAIAVDGNSTRDLVLLKPPNFGSMPLEGEADVVIRWRFAQPLIWKRERSITVRISKGDLLLLLDEKPNVEDEA